MPLRLSGTKGAKNREGSILAAAAFAIFLTTSTGERTLAQATIDANPLIASVARVVVLDGVVTSIDATVVAHAEIRLLSGATLVADTLSDTNGRYKFTNAGSLSGMPLAVPPGNYSIAAQYRSTVGRFGSVSIRSDMTAHRDIALGAIKKRGGASFVPRSTLIVTDRVAGSALTPFASAFTNERPIGGCTPTPECALHFGIIRASPPIFGIGFEPAADMDTFMAVMHSTYPMANRVTIFVHGYNNDFGDPARLAGSAVAALDLGAVPIAYSWPSKHATARYIDDETNNAWAADHFRDFLLSLLQRTDGPKTVNLVAHSMGNRLVFSAVEFIARAKPTLHGHIGKVIFAAPDVDAATFWEAVPMMATAAAGLTVYGSHHDEALQASRELHGHCRAGLFDCDDGLSLPVNVNEIDASFFECDLLGHGYWSASSTMLADITSAFAGGTMTPGIPRVNIAPITGSGAAVPGRYTFVSAAGNDGACAAEPS